MSQLQSTSARSSSTSSASGSKWPLLCGLALGLLSLALAPSDSLAAPTAGQQLAKADDEANTLGRLMLGQFGKSTSSASQLDGEQQQQLQLQQLAGKAAKSSVAKMLVGQRQKKELKAALKGKWHKIVDELIENEFLGNPEQQQQQRDSSASFVVGEPISATRGPKLADSYRNNNKDNSGDISASNTNNDDEQVVLILRKRLMPTQPSNQLDSADQLMAVGEQQHQPVSSRNNNNNNNNNRDHNQRILDDKFGIMKDSVFTANNHLGHKGVPKFGSDEVL